MITKEKLHENRTILTKEIGGITDHSRDKYQRHLGGFAFHIIGGKTNHINVKTII